MFVPPASPTCCLFTGNNSQGSYSSPDIIVPPGQDPLGKRIGRGGDAPDFRIIIGVVAPIKFQSLDEDVKKETLYHPYAQNAGTNLILVVKTDGDPTSLTAAVREAGRVNPLDALRAE